MFGIGAMELGVISMVALLLFGGRLPKLAKDIGSSMFELRKGMNEAFKDLDETA